MAQNQKIDAYGKFGGLVKEYDRGRRGYPEEVIEYLWASLSIQKPQILDLGCGTGISTRQVGKRGGIIVGCDPDEKMLDIAAQHGGNHISYVLGHAESLPFGNEQFNALTAFSAFHWFANSIALSEMRRVLKPHGLVFVVNKNEAGDLRADFRRILADTL